MGSALDLRARVNTSHPSLNPDAKGGWANLSRGGGYKDNTCHGTLLEKKGHIVEVEHPIDVH